MTLAVIETRRAETSDWRPAPGFERFYEVSRFGEVRSMLNNRKRVLTPVPNSDGYLTVKLSLRGVQRRVYINRLVCEAFNGPPIEPRIYAAHKNGKKAENRADNLIWATRQENEEHKDGHGTKASGHRNGRAKLTPSDVAVARSLWSQGATSAEIGARLGVHPSTAHRVATGQRYRSDESAISSKSSRPK